VTTVAIARCKDEVDVVEGWVRHHADEVDHVLIADFRVTLHGQLVFELQ
jgi:hypothetical protein